MNENKECSTLFLPTCGMESVEGLDGPDMPFQATRLLTRAFLCQRDQPRSMASVRGMETTQKIQKSLDASIEALSGAVLKNWLPNIVCRS
jgi:hypothetical protein